MKYDNKVLLPEAIKLCEEIYKKQNDTKHKIMMKQLKEWLEELLMYRQAFASVIEIYFEQSAEKIKDAE